VLLAAMLVAVECAKLFRHSREACTLQNGTSALHGCPDPVSGKLRFSISPQVAVYVEATNGFDLERWMAAFAHDALVNVGLQAYWEKPASSACAKRDYHRWEADDECSHGDQTLGNLIMAARWTVITMNAAYLIRWRPPFMSAPRVD
jgi:hypothetical protein